MSQPESQPEPHFVICSCQHCDGNIEFDATRLEPAEKTTVACPHCGQETTIFAPSHSFAQSTSFTGNEEIRRLRLVAEQGDPTAQLRLASAFYLGVEIPEDHVEAMRWCRLAAEAGNAEAQLKLGNGYAAGDGLPQDRVEAVKWYRLAAKQNIPEAQHNLGILLDSDNGPTRDSAEALKYWQLAAENGLADSQYLLGRIYWLGERVPPNHDEAVRWYRLAAAQGNADAQKQLGAAYGLGDGVARDPAEAAKWLRLSADQGNPDAQVGLALAYNCGQGVPQDFVEAYKWANLAAAAGLEEAEEMRTDLATKMTPSQIEDGQRASSVQASRMRNKNPQKSQDKQARTAIPSEVRREVWRRDGGACVKCGSRRNLEFDHIVPVSRGGSNTARNVELLCETCNRAKSAAIQ